MTVDRALVSVVARFAIVGQDQNGADLKTQFGNCTKFGLTT